MRCERRRLGGGSQLYSVLRELLIQTDGNLPTERRCKVESQDGLLYACWRVDEENVDFMACLDAM